MRKPLGYMPPNPKISNIFLDSCAFYPKYSPEDRASQEIFQRHKSDELRALDIAHSNQKEIDHPNTPDWVKREAINLIRTIQTRLTPNELREKTEILSILARNGKPERMVDDANHVFEASKYGAYFITTDRRILDKRDELIKVCSAIIVKPSEFLKILASY
jgi:predicted nucleic acid-binding protein